MKLTNTSKRTLIVMGVGTVEAGQTVEVPDKEVAEGLLLTPLWEKAAKAAKSATTPSEPSED